MSIRISIQWALLVIFCLSVSGCMVWPVMSDGHGYRPMGMSKDDQVLSPWATQPTVLAENHGTAVREALKSQILNPEASKNLSSIETFDGKSANLAVDRYRSFFKKPPFAKTSSESKKQ